MSTLGLSSTRMYMAFVVPMMMTAKNTYMQAAGTGSSRNLLQAYVLCNIEKVMFGVTNIRKENLLGRLCKLAKLLTIE